LEICEVPLKMLAVTPGAATMGNATNHPRIGGESVRIGDCWVWVEIRYLDSPTDYRESLPQNTVHPRQTLGDDLVMLDPGPYASKSTANPWRLLLALLSVPVIIWFLVELVER
jgi:hypothetical protein